MTSFSRKLTLFGLLCASHSAFAIEPALGWYTGLMLGATHMSSTKFTNTTITTFPLSTINISYNMGGDIAAQLGYRCNKFRFEGELLFTRTSYKKFTADGFSLTRLAGTSGFSMKGNTSIYGGIFNVFYEFYDEDYEDTTWVPYIGIGAGYSSVRNNLRVFLDNVQLNPNNDSTSTSAPVGQGILGLNYFFTDNTSLGLDLRYMTTKNIPQFNSRISVESINLVFNYTFDDL